jgi:hypothetical protein
MACAQAVVTAEDLKDYARIEIRRKAARAHATDFRAQFSAFRGKMLVPIHSDNGEVLK